MLLRLWNCRVSLSVVCARVERFENIDCIGWIIPMLYTSADEPRSRKPPPSNHSRLGRAGGRADAARRAVLRPRHRYRIRRSLLDGFAFAGPRAGFRRRHDAAEPEGRGSRKARGSAERTHRDAQAVGLPDRRGVVRRASLPGRREHPGAALAAGRADSPGALALAGT